jgi:aryl-alcohol dehydrogenase-like predicted oxidoreductase
MAQGPNVIVLAAGRTVEHALDSLTADALELSADDLAAIDGAEFSTAR